ncbi:MAG: hypothetical protein GF401_09410 [Chitinivibrionales bacterium]|nr:hypothetical protein [Chitinivibrionales bacterium]
MARYRKIECIHCPYMQICNVRVRVYENYCGCNTAWNERRNGTVQNECKLRVAGMIKNLKGNRSHTLIGLQHKPVI